MLQIQLSNSFWKFPTYRYLNLAKAKAGSDIKILIILLLRNCLKCVFHILSRVIFLLLMDIPLGSNLFTFMDAPLLVLPGIRLEFHLLLPVWLVNTSVLQLRRSWLLQCSCTETVWSSKFELATLIRHLSYCQLLFYAMLVYLASQQVNIKAGITQMIKNWLL